MRPVGKHSVSLAAAFAVAVTSSYVSLASEPVITVSRDEIRLRMDFPAPEIGAGRDGAEIRVGSHPLRASAPGHPLLPSVELTLLLPPGTVVAGAALDGAPVGLPGSHRVAWGQAPRHIGEPGGAPTPPDPAVFASDALYPERPVFVVGSGYFRGYHLVTLALTPVQLRPASGRLLAWPAMNVRLALAPASGEGARVGPPRGLASDVSALSRIAANPETALTYGETDDDGAPVPYLIVTPERLRPAFERLLQHRALHGMEGSLRTVESILATSTGRDDAEKLRNSIAEAYLNAGTTYVLLGGDDVDDFGAPLVPVRYCPDYDNGVSDYYFGALDGDWDSNGNGRFCEGPEVDYFAEVHVGRATVDTLDEANRFVDKVLAFEHGLPEERRRDLVYMGEKLDDSTWAEDAKENIAVFTPGEFDIERLYARAENFSWANVMTSLNRGPQLVNHDGHASWDYVMGIGINDVESLTNESPFFGYSIGCYSGAFDQPVSGNTEAISEHFLLARHAGIGVVMNSRYGWYYVGSSTGLSADLDREFYHALFVEGVGTLGEANDDSRADTAATAQADGTMRYCFLETNLHGDPATPVQMRRSLLRRASHRLLDGEPAYGNGNGLADPGETVEIAVTLRNEGDTSATGISAHLTSSTAGVTVHDDWAAWPDLAPSGSAENLPHHFTATFDGACGSEAAFRLEVRHDGVVDVSVFTVKVGRDDETPVFADGFESDRGWTVGGSVASGRFVREDPHAAADGFVGPVQPEDDATADGAVCWVTGNPSIAPGGDPRSGDVDNGTTSIQSPAFDGRGDGQLRLRYARWVHRTTVASLNTAYVLVRASGTDGATWLDLERVEANQSRWIRRDVDLGAVVAPAAKMRLRFEAIEGRRQPGDPLLELLVDDVEVVRRTTTCGSFAPGDTAPPDVVGPTLLLSREGEDVVLTWSEPTPDGDHGAARFFPIHRSTSFSGGFTAVAEPTHCFWRDVDAAPPVAGNLAYLVSARNAAGSSGEAPTP